MARYLGAFVTLCLAIFLVSCGRHNPLQPQTTNLELLEFAEEKIPLDNGMYIYRQTITVSDPLPDCLYAYHLETYSSELPENCYADADGWLYFPSPGIESNLPLSTPGDHRTIWSYQSSLSKDFVSSAGMIGNLITHIRVRIKDTQGRISEISSPFKSNRIVSSRIVNPSVNGAECGTGVEFVLREVIGDIFVEGLYAHHFMYRLNILDAQLQVIQQGAWFSSIDSPDIRRILLNGNSTPAISVNEPNQYTQFECYVVSRQGIEEVMHQSVHFRAVGGHRPVAMIYPQTLAGLGQHHYSIGYEDPMIVYELIPSDSQHKNRSLFMVNNQFQAINSNDFRLHIRWGYSGQYGRVVNQNIIYTNNPWDNELNKVLNPAGTNYYSSIAAFDLRFDGMPFPLTPGFIDPVVVTHTDGSTWLRVGNLN
ncbi:MAG: hypothetical protein U1B83_10335, partial [Candidatus Cloacimonadaceae bacterium]|nr:hypothetical protein [Candidatus Cloacimonadaceae bacterium]